MCVLFLSSLSDNVRWKWCPLLGDAICSTVFRQHNEAWYHCNSGPASSATLSRTKFGRSGGKYSISSLKNFVITHSRNVQCMPYDSAPFQPCVHNTSINNKYYSCVESVYAMLSMDFVFTYCCTFTDMVFFFHISSMIHILYRFRGYENVICTF